MFKEIIKPGLDLIGILYITFYVEVGLKAFSRFYLLKIADLGEETLSTL